MIRPVSPSARTPGTGMTRREALAAAAGGLVLASCGESFGSLEPDAPEPPAFVKDPSNFIVHGSNLEARLEDMDGLLTPVDRFFVRNHSPTPIIDTDAYRLSMGGPGAEREVELTLADLRALPSHSVIAYLECAGNWRRFFDSVLGQAAAGSQWGTGAIGCAEWSGPRLRDVLALAGLRPGAVDVNLHGLDDSAWQRPMPLAKAMDDDTLLALSMNGAPLHPDHGFPVRALLPGWIGAASVKWLGRIEIATGKVWVTANTTSYVLIGEHWPPADYAPASGAPIDEGAVKSALALPLPARLSPGARRLRGFAYSPHGPVSRVEWSAGTTSAAGPWRDARLIGPRLPHAWSRFEFEWNATHGNHVLRTRATDETGFRQPAEALYNAKGYLLNLALPHPVTVE